MRKEIESHGILQKFYRATAMVVMMDYEKMPYSIRRYTLALYMERLRGAVSALSVGNKRPELTWDVVESLSDALAKEVVKVARGVKDLPPSPTREDLILKIYATAIARLAEKPEWDTLRYLMRVSAANRPMITSMKR